VSRDSLQAARFLHCPTDPAILRETDFIVIAVPTPVGDAGLPSRRRLAQPGRHQQSGQVLGYQPSHTAAQGVALASEWYMEKMKLLQA
jgi:UDP-N-acetyl-D-glucosamine/UDP-N-acetyl-D-galactosamine dehydrogenase